MNTGKVAISGETEAVYEYPDSLQLQEYRPKNDGDIELKECPAYVNPIGSKQSDIDLVDCPAYVVNKKDQDIKVEDCAAYEKPNKQPGIELFDCPAYVEKKKDQNTKLEECPAYGLL